MSCLNIALTMNCSELIYEINRLKKMKRPKSRACFRIVIIGADCFVKKVRASQQHDFHLVIG